MKEDVSQKKDARRGPPVNDKKLRAPLKALTSRARWWVRHQLPLHQLQGMLLWAGLVGFGAALVTVGFREAVHAVEYLVTGHSGSFVDAASALPPWRRMLTPALGALLAGLILQYGMSFTTGRRGRTNYMEAVILGDGFISVRGSLVKSLSSLTSISSGGSIGREGAMVQLSAMLGSTLCRILRFPAPQRRIMVACGAAAGIASAYNAPLAGAVFVAEIVIGGIEFDTTAPLIVSAVIANATVHGLLDYAPVYQIPPMRMESSWEFFFFVILGMIAGRLAPIYLWLLQGSSKVFRKLRIPLSLKLLIGGLGLGCISIVTPQVWGNGYSVVNSILHDPWTVSMLLVILILKVAATALTVGSGAVGGVFTPTLFVGATLGSLVGHLFLTAVPELTGSTQVYAVVGMGAFLSATTQAPLMGVLMVFELTRQYDIVLPLMLASITASYLALPYGRAMYGTSFKKETEGKVSPLSVLAHDFPQAIEEEASLEAVRERFQEVPSNYLSVVDSEERWLGVIGRKDVAGELGDGIVARDLVRPAKHYLESKMTLERAVEAASEIPSELMPLLDSKNSKFLGTVAKSELLAVVSRSWRSRTSKKQGRHASEQSSLH